MSEFRDLMIRVELSGPEGGHCLDALIRLICQQRGTLGPNDEPFGVATVVDVRDVV